MIPEPTPATLRPSREPKVAEPPEFSGSVPEFDSFIAHCTLFFELQPSTFAEDSHKVLYVISRLRSHAFRWAKDITTDPAHPLRNDYPSFLQHLTSMYSDRTTELTAMDKLTGLKQNKSASAYAAEFVTLATALGLNDKAKRIYFRSGLSATLRHSLAIAGEPQTFAEYMAKAIEIDQGTFLAAKEEKKTAPKPNPAPQSSSSRPTQNQTQNATKRPSQFRPPISAEERQRRIDNKLCNYCAQPGHFVAKCPLKKNPSGPQNPLPTPRATPAPAYSATVSATAPSIPKNSPPQAP